MKILSAQLPKILEYYVSPNIQNQINECLDTAEVNINGNILEASITNNGEVYEAFKIIKDKMQTTTIGNGKKLLSFVPLIKLIFLPLIKFESKYTG